MPRLPLLAAALALAVALVGSTSPAHSAEPTIRIGVLLPTGDATSALAAETSYGVSLALDESAALRAAGAKRPAVEMVALSAADGATAAAVLADAAKKQVAGVVALATPETAADIETAARKAKIALVVLGPAAPGRTIDRADPVLRVEPLAADRGLALAEALRFRSGRASIGLPAQTKRAWLVVEDAAWARAIATSLHADETTGLVRDETFVPAGKAPAAADIEKARAAGCDRLVLIGGGSTLRATITALEAAAWNVPLLATDAALDGPAPPSPRGRLRGTVFLAASPTWVEARQIAGLVEKRPPPAGAGTAPTPAALRAYTAAAALIEAAAGASKGPVAARVRDIKDAPARSGLLFDAAGSIERWSWTTCVAAEDGSVAPVKASFLPDAGLGPFLGGSATTRYRPAPGSVCVRIGFGGGAGAPPRTVEADLATIGLCAREGGASDRLEVDDRVRDQILARAAAKLSRIFLRAYDGSARPAISFRISFVVDGTETAAASAVWDAYVAGDGPDSLHGGRTLSKTSCQALSTFLIRNAAPLHRAHLDPPLTAADLTYLDGTYAWNTSVEGNQRCDRIRALVDGVGSTYAMKLAKEIGHLAGLGIDTSGDPRSVMVTTGGEGTSDDVANFPPADTKILEKTLGRAP